MARKKAVQAEQKDNVQSLTLDLSQPLPLIPLRDTLILPGISSRVLIGREVSLNAIQKAETEYHSTVVLVLQKNMDDEEVSAQNLLDVGVVARILQVHSMPNGYCKVLLEGIFVVNILQVLQTKEKPIHLGAIVEPRNFYLDSVTEIHSRVESSLEKFKQYASMIDLPADLLDSLNETDAPLQVYFSLVPFLKLSLEKKQQLLELNSLTAIADEIEGALQALLDMEQLSRRVQGEVQKKMQQSQRDWLISEQIRLLQGELSNDDTGSNIELLLSKIKEKKFSENIQEKLEEEVSRLRLMPPGSPEYAQIQNYLDWFLSFPYGIYTKTDLNLKEVQKALDSGHFGLEKVKERILEFIAVLRLTAEKKVETRAPILCLVGPPGVGKTTLVSSVARAIGREFVRITLGGVRDEAEIRGHRRTYVGAMPGRFIQGLRRAKCMNPVILLDEIDKMASDFRGDPASALLELLDPEQNKNFTDHFMEVGFDLSKVLFIATANTESDIPPALFDRLEVVRLSGYYKYEKLSIAENYLIPNVLKRSGLETSDLTLSKEQIEKIISEYTREAGVRELDRLLEKVARAKAKEIVLGKAKGKSLKTLSNKKLQEYLGVPRFTNNMLPKPGCPGRITGLAWTSVGGEILSIECMLLSGKGQVILTGKLGDVMKESIQIAISLVRARLLRYEIDPQIIRKTDIHIHVPEGAVPKDGPSAGIAMTLAILSAFTKIPVDPAIAFTGEVSLTGNLLPIGGLNEKALAAKEAGVQTLYIPYENGKDVEELPLPAKESLKINLMHHIDDIIRILLPLPKDTKKQKTKRNKKS